MRVRSLQTYMCAPALVALAAAFTLSACGPTMTPAERAVAEQGLSAENGLSPNGLSMNGLSMNGLSMNGLSMNGLSMNGLSTTSFSTWFESNVALGDTVMKYVVRCAVANGGSRTYTSTSTGLTYTWNGYFGLTPGWASGSPATEMEQQLVTACLTAHVNKFGVHVPISIQGRDSNAVEIPLEANENTTYSVKEACFFGNFFTSDGILVVLDHGIWDDKTTSARACALENKAGFDVDCPPIVVLTGNCGNYCTKRAGKNYYDKCTYNGKTYRPLTTRLRTQDIYKCGDGVCQFTESCGTGGQWNNCATDCGPCL